MTQPKTKLNFKLFKSILIDHAKKIIYWIIFKLERYKPHVEYLWERTEAIVSKTFALSDHSSLRRVRALFRAGVALLVIFFLWATFFKINQVVHTQGEVIASSYTQIVQSADGGVLVDMKVREGDIVQAGDVIAILEKDRALASYAEVRDKVMATRMTTIRLQAEIAGESLVYDEAIKRNYSDLYQTQLSLFSQRTKTIRDQLKLLKENVDFAQQELNMSLPLERLGDISKVDILRIKRALNEARNLYSTARNRYLQDANTELNKAQEDLGVQQQTLLDREQLVKHTDIIAPATGIVKSVKFTTLGGVIRQGDEILQILPTESDLVVEAKIKPGDMANIGVGRMAKIKLDAYDSSIFGSMNGKITYVSADALKEDNKSGATSYYRVRLSINEHEFKKSSHIDGVEVRPGMTVTIDIETGKRSIMSYLFKPLIKTFKGALGER